jgi:UDP-N-acetyl-alpha-D-quinovosamine dehydrogenase
MKKILVTGANGFVGKVLCGEVVRRAVAVAGATRAVCALPVGVEPIVIGTMDQRTDWQSALRGVDVVIHLAARVHVMREGAGDPLAEFCRVNVLGTERLGRAAAASGVKRLVYVSSIKVNGETTYSGQKYTEADPPVPQDPYGISKWEAEQALHRVVRETGLEVVIVRPPLVYGPGVKGNFAQMLKVLSKGMPLPLASIHNLRSLLYVENLVDALIVCAAHPAAAGQTYLVSDGEDISTPALMRSLASAMGKPARLFPCPPALLKGMAGMLGRGAQLDRLLGSLQVDSARIRRDLNWVPPHSLQQGLRATADWYRTKHT